MRALCFQPGNFLKTICIFFVNCLVKSWETLRSAFDNKIVMLCLKHILKRYFLKKIINMKVSWQKPGWRISGAAWPNTPSVTANGNARILWRHEHATIFTLNIQFFMKHTVSQICSLILLHILQHILTKLTRNMNCIIQQREDKAGTNPLGPRLFHRPWTQLD